ncbi:PepSY domain-containing protein [Xanthobacter sp. V4C-4]|uniref:PepSY domain-containing protein n=1 Tax=Xanthobacter cornucopiae TaxID=3119924 RepID=UPI00372CD243
MSLARVRPLLIGLHRWVALVLTPVFLVIIVTGAVLSFRPILSGAAERAEAESRVDATALGKLVKTLEAGGPVTMVSLAEGGRAAIVASPAADIAGQWDIASATRTRAGGGIDVFRTAEQLHKSLLLGLSLVVEAASLAMLAIMLFGPLLAWLRFRNSLMGWHMAVGWCLLPVTLTAPVTAAMLIFSLGTGPRAPLPRVEKPVGIAEALAVATRNLDTTRLVSARRFRGGTVMVRLAGEKAGAYVVTGTGVTPLPGGPGLVKQIHEGTWAGAWSGGLNVAMSLALLGLTVTGFASWFQRWRRDRAVAVAAGADILVAYASQTGTAARLADLTCQALMAGGARATLAPLGAVAPEALQRFPLILVIAATTGEGEVPDGARHLLKRLAPGALAGVRFCVLGLGERTYAHFCRGAHTLRDALIAAGATEALAMIEADGDPSAPWSRWMERLGTDLGLACAPVATAPATRLTLTLAERRRLDNPAHGGTQETWGLVLASDRDLDFRPGDLIRLTPPEGGRERAYSVGSSARVDPRRIELTVRLHRWHDATSGPGDAGPGQAGEERFGQVSGFLLRAAPLGGTLQARLDPHPHFNLPADPTWPVLMIGAGSGIAPFPGFLDERRASGRAGPAWLIFGNRHRDGDFLWRDRFEAALADGTLTRLDTAFSRDGAAGAPGVHVPSVHVQDCLAAADDEVLRWMLDEAAVIYVCGQRAMARGVEDTLARVLVEKGGYAPDAARAEIGRWIGEGRIRIDAFD